MVVAPVLLRAFARRLVLGLWAVSLLWPSASSAVTTNKGVVLVLHAVTDSGWELGDTRSCETVSLGSLSQVKTRLRGDGKPQLVMLYAAFPPDSAGDVAGACFGIRYTDNVRVLSFGACNGKGLEASAAGWPASGSGTSTAVIPAATGNLVPLYWFALSAKGPGKFSVEPHPLVNLGAKVANSALPSVLAPVTGFGRVGFDLEGEVPTPGQVVAKQGICCVDGCWFLSDLECAHYAGVFLGPNVTDCEELPCGGGGPPLKGGCCLPGGCEPYSAVDCARLGGYFLGEGVDCDSLPCPGTEGN